MWLERKRPASAQGRFRNPSHLRALRRRVISPHAPPSPHPARSKKQPRLRRVLVASSSLEAFQRRFAPLRFAAASAVIVSCPPFHFVAHLSRVVWSLYCENEPHGSDQTINSPVENANTAGLKPLRAFPTGSPLTGVRTITMEDTNMKNLNEHCDHVYEEAVCVHCGTEYASLNREPVQPGFLVSAIRRFWFALRTGINPNWVSHLSPRERTLEIRRLKYNAAKFANADRAAQIRREQFSSGPIVGILFLGFLVVVFMFSSLAYCATHQPAQPTSSAIPANTSHDHKWPDKCNPSVPGAHCTATAKKEHTVIIIRPAQHPEKAEQCKPDRACDVSYENEEAPD